MPTHATGQDHLGAGSHCPSANASHRSRGVARLAGATWQAVTGWAGQPGGAAGAPGRDRGSSEKGSKLSLLKAAPLFLTRN